ncbi:hypothetical protein EBZ35_08665, partial [bacterium]|nr:hypothetical protein [bacterium]
MWFDASTANALELDASGIRKWFDLSGNRRHLTQPIVSNRPTWNGTINGLRSIRFPTANFSYMTVQDGDNILGVNSTVLAVFNWNNTNGMASTASIVSKVTQAGGYGAFITWTDGVPRLGLSTTKARVMDTSGRYLVSPMVLMWDVSPIRQSIGVNGVETATVNATPESGATGTILGLSEQVSGNITLMPGALPTSSIGVSPNRLGLTNYYVMSFGVPGVSTV